MSHDQWTICMQGAFLCEAFVYPLHHWCVFYYQYLLHEYSVWLLIGKLFSCFVEVLPWCQTIYDNITSYKQIVDNGKYTKMRSGDGSIVVKVFLNCSKMNMFKPVWVSDAIRRHRSGSVSAQSMACCPPTPRLHLQLQGLTSLNKDGTTQCATRFITPYQCDPISLFFN